MTTRIAPQIDGLKVARARLALAHENGRPVSQFKLAERAGIHYVTVSNIERGAARRVTLETIGKLADALGLEIADLLVADEEEVAALPGGTFRGPRGSAATDGGADGASGAGAVDVTEDAA